MFLGVPMKLSILLHLISCLLASDPPDPIDPLEAQLRKMHKRPPTDARGRLLPIDYEVNITSSFLHNLDTASMTMWLRLVEQYRNPSLGWSLTAYPQPAIPVSAGDIYLPELRSCSGGVLERKIPTEIQVDHTGLVTVRSEGIMTSMCRPLYDTYPYDRNDCFMCFETHRAGTKARLTVLLNDTYLKGTPELVIIGPLILAEDSEYDEGGVNFKEVLIKVVLQRNPTVIMLMVFLPALLLYIEIFLVLRFPDVEEFKMLLEGTSVYATLNLAIVEVLARTNTLPGIGKYTSGSQVVLLLLSILFVLIRHWKRERAEPKSSRTGRRPIESWPTKHHGVLLLEESQTSTSPSSFGYTTSYREYLTWARGWIDSHPEPTALAVVSIAALIAPILLSLYSFK